MVDDERNIIITATVGGRRRRLATRKQWRTAIANNDITRDTQVDYEPGPGSKSTIAAGDIPELDAFFEELHGPREVTPPPPPPPPPPSVALTSPRPPTSKRAKSKPAAKKVPEAPTEFEDGTPSSYSDSTSKVIGVGCAVLVAVILFAVIVNRLLDIATSPRAEPEPTHVVTASSLNCRAEPSTQSAVVMGFMRGEQIVSEGERNGWIKSQNGCWVSADHVRALVVAGEDNDGVNLQTPQSGNVELEWLVGDWVPMQVRHGVLLDDPAFYCGGTDNFYRFEAGGAYSGVSDSGRYEVINNGFTLLLTQRLGYVLGGDESEQEFPLDPTSLNVRRVGERLEIDGWSYRRC